MGLLQVVLDDYGGLFIYSFCNNGLVVNTYSKEYVMKELIAQRVPPGDRWTLIDEDSDIVFGSLTDCLNQIFNIHKATQFFVDAKKGEVYIEDGVEKPQPIKKFSLYGEEVWYIVYDKFIGFLVIWLMF